MDLTRSPKSPPLKNSKLSSCFWSSRKKGYLNPLSWLVWGRAKKPYPRQLCRPKAMSCTHWTPVTARSRKPERTVNLSVIIRIAGGRGNVHRFSDGNGSSNSDCHHCSSLGSCQMIHRRLSAVMSNCRLVVIRLLTM